jgi:hypothetical protein
MEETTQQPTTVADTILALERRALDRWGKGDPDGYLEINAPDVSYFDPYLRDRLDGFSNLKERYEALRGKISIEKDEIINPRVQVIGDVAVLTMLYVSYSNEASMRWNCTEIYRRQGDDWKIIHSHWSFTERGTTDSAIQD